MPDGAELILSKSSIDVWFDCERKWLYTYTYRIPGAPNLDMAIGTAVHAGVEAYWIQGEGYEAEETERALDRELALMPALNPSVAAQALVDGLAMTKLYVEKIAPTFPVPPTLIEADFLIRVDGVLVSGRIDVGTDEEVRDTKTTSTPSKVDPTRYGLDMALYSWGARSLTGTLPRRFYLDVVARNGRFAVKEVEPDYAGAAEIVGLVAKGIAAGEFKPTGAAKGECVRCPYSGICPSALLTPAVESSAILESSSNLEVPLA